MSRLQKALAATFAKNEKAFVPYIMAGDGGLDILKERVLFLEECGATAIEIGIPFTDPVADGPTIQEAGLRSLKSGTTLRKVLAAVEEMRPHVSIPLIIMTYMNPVFAYGIPAFVEDAKNAGVDGFIIPDLPIDEEGMIEPELTKAGIELIRLVTLTSPLKRIKEISSRGNGFLYAVTVTGTTGERAQFQERVGEYLQNIKEVSPLPVLAGFGISTSAHVRDICRYCDGVIVGSKIIDLFNKNKKEEIRELIAASKMKLQER